MSSRHDRAKVQAAHCLQVSSSLRQYQSSRDGILLINTGTDIDEEGVKLYDIIGYDQYFDDCGLLRQNS